MVQMAMDVLTAQASAVPCEQVFSSSKETDTKRRSRLSPTKMQELQILKYIFRNERLTFTANLLCSEEELTVMDIPDDLIHHLLAERRLYDLDKYILTSKSASISVPMVGPTPTDESECDTVDYDVGEEYVRDYGTNDEYND